MFEAIADGRVKAVWIISTNPVVSLPDADRVRAALDLCELVVVSDCMRDTDTTRHGSTASTDRGRCRPSIRSPTRRSARGGQHP